VSIEKSVSRYQPACLSSREPDKTDEACLNPFPRISFVSRRGFVATFMVAAASATFAAWDNSAQAAGRTATPQPITDTLNFVLNLEYLEANFYLYATSGHGLSHNETGDGPQPTGIPVDIPFLPDTRAVIHSLAQDEVNHIILLRAAITSLGGSPIPQPAIHYGALGTITSEAQYLATARRMITLGNSAYTGSAQFLTRNPNVLTTIAQILGARGQHAGMVNSLCVAQQVAQRTFEEQGRDPEKTNCFTVTPGSGISPARTYSEVLGIAYGGFTSMTVPPAPGTALGGVFPLGANGNIKST